MARVRMVEYKGESMRMAELSRRTGIPQCTLYHRIVEGGMTAEAAVLVPYKNVRMHKVGGEWLTIGEMAERSGVKTQTIEKRLNRGDAPEAAMRPVEEKDERHKCGEDAALALKWPRKAFAMLYGAARPELMGFRRLSENNWGWASEYFTYMASKLGGRYMLLRAWWRDTEEPALLRLYRLKEREGMEDVLEDVLEEVVQQGHKEAVLRRWGLI